jgi:ABC-type bacteriocin/lantibiotic exporter with double-glycine peptidase domain
MPTRLLSIPHRLQENEAGCLAACAQIVLEHVGIKQSQVFLNRLLGLTSIGTPYSNIRRLAQLNVTVTMQPGDANDVRNAIDRNLPVVVFLLTGVLPYWKENTSHAAVVVGYGEETVLLNDPLFEDAPQSVRWNEFMFAWSEQDYMYALVMR